MKIHRFQSRLPRFFYLSRTDLHGFESWLDWESRISKETYEWCLWNRSDRAQNEREREKSNHIEMEKGVTKGERFTFEVQRRGISIYSFHSLSPSVSVFLSLCEEGRQSSSVSRHFTYCSSADPRFGMRNYQTAPIVFLVLNSDILRIPGEPKGFCEPTCVGFLFWVKWKWSDGDLWFHLHR